MPSGSHPSVLSGGSSSFGQFRLTTFVDSNPTPKASPALRTTPDEPTEKPASLDVENGSAMSSSHILDPFTETLQGSSDLDNASSNPVAPGVTAADTASKSHNGFGVLDLAPAPAVREGKLGPHRDGRVRNPIPRKLKGKTDEKSGNFAVMHMDMTGSGSPYDLTRGEAAKRTSESTAEAARNANSAGYVPMKRRRVEAPAIASPENLTGTGSRFLSSVTQQEFARRDRILTAEETKYEQARLLTVLRSIAPLTVVDQICKALAFFGGIPGAPPPGDGVFPTSAEANGSGSLFVGWLSEIFPDLERKGWKTAVAKPVQPLPEPVRMKRPRGRPKGSKASKVRKDKGVKKGPKYPGKDDNHDFQVPLPHLRPATLHRENLEEDEDWIDVTGMDENFNESNQRNDVSTEQNGGQREPLDLIMDVNHRDMGAIEQYPPTANMGKRRPGRPRGSRNRPRDLDIELDAEPRMATSALVSAGLTASDVQPFAEVENTTPSKRKRGRPPLNKAASYINPGSSVPPTPADPGGLTPAAQARPQLKAVEMPRPAPAPAAMSGLSVEEQAILEAFRTARAAQGANVASDKKKRGPRKSAAATPSAPQETSVTGSGLVPSPMVDQIVSSPVVPAPIQPSSNPQTTPRESPAILPPPKRQRKPKDANVPTPAKKIAKPDVPKSIPASNAISQPIPITSEATIPPRPAPQGLEAHYEHFASLQQQQQQQQKQQHERQQQARLEKNSVSRSSPMQTSSSMQSSPFFAQSQTRHISSPYGQQYPSHQPSNPYQQSTLSSQTDSFRSVNQPRNHSTFSPRQSQQQVQQQQSSHHSSFSHNSHSHSHFPDSSSLGSNFIDPLENVTNGHAAAGVSAYGVGAGNPRSASSSSYGTGVVAQLSGFEVGDSDIRDRLMRGLGRR